MKRKSDNAEIRPANGIGPGAYNLRDLIVARDIERRKQQEQEVNRARATAKVHGMFEGRLRQIVEDDARVIREPDVLDGFTVGETLIVQ